MFKKDDNSSQIKLSDVILESFKSKSEEAHTEFILDVIRQIHEWRHDKLNWAVKQLIIDMYPPVNLYTHYWNSQELKLTAEEFDYAAEMKSWEQREWLENHDVSEAEKTYLRLGMKSGDINWFRKDYKFSETLVSLLKPLYKDILDLKWKV